MAHPGVRAPHSQANLAAGAAHIVRLKRRGAGPWYSATGERRVRNAHNRVNLLRRRIARLFVRVVRTYCANGAVRRCGASTASILQRVLQRIFLHRPRCVPTPRGDITRPPHQRRLDRSGLRGGLQLGSSAAEQHRRRLRRLRTGEHLRTEWSRRSLLGPLSSLHLQLQSSLSRIRCVCCAC